MEELIKKWRDETWDINFPFSDETRELMALEIYKRYKEDIDKIYKKIYKQIKKKPNKRYYYINAEKYNDKEVISLRNFFDYSFEIKNNKPVNKNAYTVYYPASNNITYTASTSNVVAGISDITTTSYSTSTGKEPIIKPASFYICW